MKVSKIHSSVNFKRALTSNELEDYKKVLSQARKVTGQTGKSIFIMPSTCLPQSSKLNTGVGHIASSKAQEYYKFMHNYLGCNVIEDLPLGQVQSKKGFYCSYDGSAFALGNHQICPELLTTKEYEHLLTQDEVQNIVKANNSSERDAIANFKNVMDADGEQNKVLMNAYKRFLKLEEASELKIRYKKFETENNDWLNFPRYSEPDLDFFKFKQFLAEEHLKKGKEALNKLGVKYAGDCQIGFSHDEVRAFPEAFKKNHFIGLPGWRLPALNYENILDENSPSYKLLKRKVQLNAKRYDIIRFDVGWAYVTPVITPAGEKSILDKNRVYMGDKILKNIEKWVQEIKGPDFDLHNLIYEFAASSNEFQAFDGENLIKPLQGRVKIYGSTYMHSANGNKWGYNQAFLEKGWSPDEFIIGVGNHDPQPLRQIANDMPEKIQIFDAQQKSFKIIESRHKQNAIKPLSEELKISPDKLESPVEFAKAKFAEPMTAKNNHYFYMDVFGRLERFDMQGLNTTVHPEKNYAYKVPENFEKAYIDSLENGFGFNVMDSLQKVFKAKGYDKQHPKLYKKIVKYNAILSGQKLPDEVKINKFVKIGIGVASVLTLAGALTYVKKKKDTVVPQETQYKLH